MNNVREYLSHLMIYVKALSKWLLVSSIVVLVCGLLGSAFSQEAISRITDSDSRSEMNLFMVASD